MPGAQEKTRRTRCSRTSTDWIAEQPGTDPARIVVAGASAGGDSPRPWPRAPETTGPSGQRCNWIGRKPGDDSPEITEYGKTMADFVIDQFEVDLRIWAHQRYSDPPALSRKESRDSPRCANGRGSSTPPGGATAPARPGSGAVAPRPRAVTGTYWHTTDDITLPHDRKASRRGLFRPGPSLPGRHRQPRHRNDQPHPRASRSGSGWAAMLLAREDRAGRGRDRRYRAGRLRSPTDRPKPQVVPIPTFTTPRRGRREHGNDRLSGRDHRNPHIEYMPTITRRFPVAHVLCAPPRAPTCDSQPPTTRTFRWYSACA